MLKKYIIRAGFSFVMPDGEVLSGGDKIDLEDDVAQQHLHKLEAQPEPGQKEPKKTPASKTMAIETPAPAGVADAQDPGAADTGAGASTDPA